MQMVKIWINVTRNGQIEGAYYATVNRLLVNMSNRNTESWNST